jgi:hypothetical protein
MRKETPWGVWDHIPLESLLAELEGLRVPWWIAGGYAIDAFAGSGRRGHEDIDFSAFHSDQLAVQEHLASWELQCADPPGTLRPWEQGEVLPSHVHDIWVRRDANDDWRFQLMLNPGGPDELVFRRDQRLRWPLEQATWLKDGVRYLAPEIQLLFKSRGQREKDERDFEDCLPLLSSAQRSWLRDALVLVHPNHSWITRLGLDGPR